MDFNHLKMVKMVNFTNFATIKNQKTIYFNLLHLKTGKKEAEHGGMFKAKQQDKVT